MAVILSVWLLKHYTSNPVDYMLGTERIALIKIDRDLRLADAMAGDGPLLRWLAGVKEPAQVRQDALEVFHQLAEGKSLTAKGLEAYAVITAKQNDLPMRETLEQILPKLVLTNFMNAAQLLTPVQAAWWHAEVINSRNSQTRTGMSWLATYEIDSLRLKKRALSARSATFLLGLIGLIFVPGVLIRLRKGLSKKAHCYGNAWPLPLGLMVFLAATLSWIGFTVGLDFCIGLTPELHPAMLIFFDSAARFLPPLIAIALLFKRPTHAMRVFGMFRPIALRGVLGMFSLLTLTDQVLRWAIKSLDKNEPGGGLNPSEMGLWGLAFMIISACVLAPITEEITYRGILFRSINNKLGAFLAALISSIIFALLHFYDGYGFATVAVFGFSCAALYSATGSLATVILLHVIYNMAIKFPNWIIYHAPL